MDWFTLDGVQADYDRQNFLTQSDIDYANQLLVEGNDYQFVVNCIRSWVKDTNDAVRAIHFQKWSY